LTATLKCGENAKSAFKKHSFRPSHHPEQTSGLHHIKPHARFPCAACIFGKTQKNLVKQGNVFFSGNGTGAGGDASQGVHNLCDINAVGTPDTAGMAGSAEPYTICGQYFIPMAILDMAEQLVWQDIHGEIERTSSRALLTLKTVLYRLSALVKDFR